MNENENKISYFTLDYEYQHTGGKRDLATPNIDKVNVITIRQTSELIQQISIYSNGFILYIEQSAGKIIWRTNRPIYQIGDGKFSIEDPEQ